MRSRSYTAARVERGSAPTLTPAAARVAWRRLADAIAMAVGDADPGLAFLRAALKCAPRDSFPLLAGDVRGRWAAELWDQAERWRQAGPATQALFGPPLLALARAVEAVALEQGAAVNQAAMSRMGFREDD